MQIVLLIHFIHLSDKVLLDIHKPNLVPLLNWFENSQLSSVPMVDVTKTIKRLQRSQIDLFFIKQTHSLRHCVYPLSQRRAIGLRV